MRFLIFFLLISLSFCSWAEKKITLCTWYVDIDIYACHQPSDPELLNGLVTNL